MKLPRPEIKTIERKPLPQGFFDPPPPAPRVSDRDDFAPHDNLYIEVPISGVIGTDVFSEGVADALRYARRHRVEHVVFVVDSPGGNLDEAAAIYKELRKHANHLRYHALVRNCLDVALAVPIWCDTFNMVPGAQVGGTDAAYVPAQSAGAARDEVLRSQIASDVARQAERRGRPSRLVRAMIDPLEVVAAWTDEDGEIEYGPTAPADIPADRLIFAVGNDRALVVDYEQAVALGIPRFKGTVQDLGTLLEIPNWKAESNYGSRAMANAMEKELHKQAKVEADFEQRVERNIARREMAERYIEDNLKQAAEWSPTNDSYQSYSSRWRWGWGRGYRSSNTWTQESQRRWRDRTDATAYYLERAAKGVKTAADLDGEAVELGLEPTFSPGELEQIANDIQTKYNYLGANRNRRGN